MWFKLTERVSRVALNFLWLSEVEADDDRVYVWVTWKGIWAVVKGVYRDGKEKCLCSSCIG